MKPKTQNLTLKKQAMIKALEDTLGIVTHACKKVGIERVTHYAWLKEDAVYKAHIDNLNNVVVDFAESSLLKRVKEGSDTAIIFLLKCKGKDRGYGQDNYTKTEVTTTTPENQTLTIKIKSDSSIDEFK